MKIIRVYLTEQEAKYLTQVLAEKHEQLQHARYQYLKDQPEARDLCQSIMLAVRNGAVGI